MSMFVFEDEDSGQEDIDWSDLIDEEEEELADKYEGFSFAEDIPEAKDLTDPSVKRKARKARKKRSRKVENSSFQTKREAGWSYYCAHKDHLPNLCERDMDRGEIEFCKCPCHSERDYTYRGSVSRQQEEVIELTL